jgi:hypothetical protein
LMKLSAASNVASPSFATAITLQLVEMWSISGRYPAEATWFLVR